MDEIGFGGSCHWCTEAIFLSLKGVVEVKQGWITSDGNASEFSEAVIVNYDPQIISLATLIAIHLYTHSCTADHSMRHKYRSAIYTLSDTQAIAARRTIDDLRPEFDKPVITTVLPLIKFRLNREEYLNYYYKDPEKPFCKNIGSPKLKALMDRFGDKVLPGLIH